jgi:peptide/nickel transport system permease protein
MSSHRVSTKKGEDMASFLAKRFLSGVLLLFAISSLAFFLIYASTKNIARNILGEGATNDQIQKKSHELGLDQRYFSWLNHAVHGNFGSSWANNDSVVSEILRRLPVTLSLVVIAILIAAVLATALGVLAAVRGGIIDRIVQVLAVAGFAIPGFIIAIILVTFLAVKSHILPATGWVAFGESPIHWAKSITLPVISLVIATMTSSAQQIRSAVKSVLERDYIRTLTSRGIPRREIIIKHVLRAAAPAGLTVLSLQFVGMLGGTVIVEKIFALPGMGDLVVNATASGDTPLIMGIVVYTVIIVIVINLIVDLINGWLNPKVRV